MVELAQLEPGVGGMFELRLDDDDPAVSDVDNEAVRLTPTGSIAIGSVPKPGTFNVAGAIPKTQPLVHSFLEFQPLLRRSPQPGRAQGEGRRALAHCRPSHL